MTKTAFVVIDPAFGNAVPGLAQIADRARDYAANAQANNTRRAYRADWTHWNGWALRNGFEPMPATPAALALYLSEHATILKVATLQRRLTAINQIHRLAGHHLDIRHPALRETWKGIKRTHGVRQTGKTPAMTDDIRAMVAVLGDDLASRRDRALLLIGFAGAFRRSELVGLDISPGGQGCGYVEAVREGLRIHLLRSKTDQDGEGRVIGIPLGSHPRTCPVRALETWLAAAGLAAGPIFRAVNRHGQVAAARLSTDAVADIVKKRVAAVGLDPARYAGHSLRAGLATSAAAAGVEERAIMKQTGHRSVTMVRRYIRDGEVFRENAVAKLGL